jgi:succinate dehydrogenase flavin-adding protein (antitoxin of CptAB toxin-antitoxin module)
LYRSRQRGYLELDLLLGKWASDNVEQLDDKGLGALVEFLDEVLVVLVL